MPVQPLTQPTHERADYHYQYAGRIGSLNGHKHVMDFLVGLIALLYFLMISAATKQHFVSEKYPSGMYLISILSLVGIVTFVAHAFVWGLTYTAAPLILIPCALALFIWATRHSDKRNLSLAFDDTSKVDGIITQGPWKYVRHPFYQSYALFWLACALGTMHPTSIAVFASLAFVYAYSAIREEGVLKRGPHGDAYLEYQRQAGFVLPKLPRGTDRVGQDS